MSFELFAYKKMSFEIFAFEKMAFEIFTHKKMSFKIFAYNSYHRFYLILRFSKMSAFAIFADNESMFHQHSLIDPNSH